MGLEAIWVTAKQFPCFENHSWPLRHMTAVYNRWERLPEMSRALERWGAQVERIVTGEGATKVVTFKR